MKLTFDLSLSRVLGWFPVLEDAEHNRKTKCDR